MPTLDELRTVLADGERFAGDRDTVLRQVARRTAAAAAHSSPAAGRRRIGYALAAAAAVVAAIAVPLVTRSGSPGGTRTSGGRVHIHLAAFSLDSNPDGTIALQTNTGAAVDPGVLRHALAQAGVPAIVTVGTICAAPGPRAPEPALHQVITSPPGSRTALIVPSAIPAGKKLDISIVKSTTYATDGTQVPTSMWIYDLVPDDVPLTCSPTPPANGAYGVPVSAPPTQH